MKLQYLHTFFCMFPSCCASIAAGLRIIFDLCCLDRVAQGSQVFHIFPMCVHAVQHAFRLLI